jgi:hypothetical protein
MHLYTPLHRYVSFRGPVITASTIDIPGGAGPGVGVTLPNIPPATTAVTFGGKYFGNIIGDLTVTFAVPGTFETPGAKIWSCVVTAVSENATISSVTCEPEAGSLGQNMVFRVQVGVIVSTGEIVSTVPF